VTPTCACTRAPPWACTSRAPGAGDSDRQTGELQSRAPSLCPHLLLNACPCLLSLLCPKWREYKRKKKKAYLHCAFVEVLLFLFSLCGEQQNKLILTSVASLCLVAEWWGTAVDGDTRSPLNIILFLWRGRGERERGGQHARLGWPNMRNKNKPCWWKDRGHLIYLKQGESCFS
jgi:hypothetical protein